MSDYAEAAENALAVERSPVRRYDIRVRASIALVYALLDIANAIRDLRRTP